jgi:hypothetical protein
MFVVVSCKFGFVQIYVSLNGDIKVQIIYIDCEEFVVGVNV